MEPRIASFPIDPVFLDRWSPRAFQPEEIDQHALLTMLEAARWAPSAFNEQPWRFLYALRGDLHWPEFLASLDDFNRGWAQNAAALVFVLSDAGAEAADAQAQSPALRSFDTGAAWSQLALQATRLGYHAHAMAGLEYDVARRNLAVPGRFRIEIAVAIGRRGTPDLLPQGLREREQPSQRRPLAETAFAGPFPA